VEEVGKVFDSSDMKVMFGLFGNPIGGICQVPVTKANI